MVFIRYNKAKGEVKTSPLNISKEQNINLHKTKKPRLFSRDYFTCFVPTFH